MSQVKAYQVASKNLITIDPEATLNKARDLLREKRIRHLVVTDASGVVGVLSDRIAASGETKVKDLMSSALVSVEEETPIKEVVQKMLDDKVSALLVTHGPQKQNVVAIVTTDDLLRILLQYLNDDHKSFWGEKWIENVYSVPVSAVLEILSNTGI